MATSTLMAALPANADECHREDWGMLREFQGQRTSGATCWLSLALLIAAFFLRFENEDANFNKHFRSNMRGNRHLMTKNDT